MKDAGDPDAAPAPAFVPASDDGEYTLSFPFTAASERPAEAHAALLNVFVGDPAALDQAAEDIGFILAAHASLAAREVGERLTQERLIENLRHALLSRDVIGQAKGMLMERLQTTPDGAFEVLRRSSQLLNIKLRDVARTLTQTGRVEPDHLNPA